MDARNQEDRLSRLEFAVADLLEVVQILMSPQYQGDHNGQRIASARLTEVRRTLFLTDAAERPQRVL